MALKFWRSRSSRFKRILTMLACFLFSFMMTIAGILTPLSSEESKARSDELKQMQEEIGKMDVWQSTIFIFANNFRISLLMFVPAIGPFIGSYVLYNTGVMVGAESNSMQVPGVLVFLLLFIFPFTWMEFIAYSIALAASVWLTWRLIQHRGKEEIVKTGLYIAVCAAMLFAAAFIEAYIIASFPQT